MNYITLTSTASAFLSFEGYFYDQTIFVYLSSTSNTVFPYVCSLNLFPSNSALRNSFPTLTGYPYNNYTVINSNALKITICKLPQTGVYDIVVGNNAGYTSLSYKNYLLSAAI
jgi:hypothetical protein